MGMSAKTLSQMFPTDATESDPPTISIRSHVTSTRIAWVVLLVAAVADVATTVYGLHIGLYESNPVVRSFVTDYGAIVMVGLKAVAIGYTAMGFAVVSQLSETRWVRISLVGTVSLVWLGATGVNLWRIAVVL